MNAPTAQLAIVWVTPDTAAARLIAAQMTGLNFVEVYSQRERTEKGAFWLAQVPPHWQQGFDVFMTISDGDLHVTINSDWSDRHG